MFHVPIPAFTSRRIRRERHQAACKARARRNQIRKEGGSGSGTVERPRRFAKLAKGRASFEATDAPANAEPSGRRIAAPEVVIKHPTTPHLHGADGVFFAGADLQSGIDALSFCAIPAAAIARVDPANACAGNCVAKPNMTPINSRKRGRRFTSLSCGPLGLVSIDRPDSRRIRF
jgi:hypothetical protein